MEGLTLDGLRQDLKRSHLRPVYLLLGPELYLRSQAVTLLKRTALAPEAFAFDYSEFSAKSAAMDQILEAANTFPMLSRLRFVLVKEMESIPETEHEAILAYLGRPATRSVLVLTASELDGRTTFTKRLKEKTCLIEFPQLKGGALRDWVEEYIRRKGSRISLPALGKLLDLAGSDLLSLVNEVEKLLLYQGEEKNITESAVDQLVPSSREHTVFELTDAIAKRDRRNAIRLLTNLLESGEPPLYVSNMIGRHFRQVLIAKEMLDAGEDARAVGIAVQVPPRYLDNFIRQARVIDLGMARGMYVRLAEVDRQLKSSGVDPKLILEFLVHSL